MGAYVPHIFTMLPRTQRAMVARSIYEQFCKEDATSPANLDSKTTQRVKQAVETSTFTEDLFNEAQRQIFHLLRQDCWPRFMKAQNSGEFY